MPRPWIVLALSLAGSPLAAEQGPVFLSPPNTTPARDIMPSFSYVRKGDETDLNLQASYGVRSKVSLGLGATMITDAGGPLELGRLQIQTKLRLHQKVGDGTRTIVGVSGGWAFPLGNSVDQVARANGVTRVSLTLSASHTTRRTGYVGSAQYTLDEHNTGDRATGTAGGAFSWRLKPVPPGATGGPGLAFFFEGLGHIESDNSAWLAVAPGFVYRISRTQFKVGVRLPVKRWNSRSTAVISIGTSMFIPVQ